MHQDHYGKFGDVSEESIKQKNQSLQQCASNGRNRFIWKPVLQKGTSSRYVLYIHKISKHDPVIYGTVKVLWSKLQEGQINLPVNKL